MPDFPISLQNAPTFDGALPGEVDVAVVGGGIIGVLVAWELGKRGQTVLLAEKGRIAGEQSSRNWGWIRQQGRHYAELPIMVDTMAIWKAFDRRIQDRIGFRQSGITYLARDIKRLGQFEDWLEGARGLGVDSRMLSRREIADLLPDARGWVGGLTTPSDAVAEPFAAVPVLARAAAADGVTIRENCAVRAFDIKGGAIEGIFTERGRVKCDRVVVAAGAWSALLLGRHGISIPQLSVRASVFNTRAMPNFFNAAAADDRLAFRRRADGGYSIATWATHDFFLGPDAFRHFWSYLPQLREELANTRFRLAAPAGYPDAWRLRRRWDSEETTPFERCRILDPAPNGADLRYLRRLFAEAFPAFEEMRIERAWAGMIDTMPDALPVVDEAPVSGVTIATGMSGHGFGIAPGMALAIADLVQSQAPRHDLRAFSFERFL